MQGAPQYTLFNTVSHFRIVAGVPELAEVEFYRKQWDPGVGKRIVAVSLHGARRVFRGADSREMVQRLKGAVFRDSHAHGKQMLFRFGAEVWLTVHLGMTGKLRIDSQDFRPGKHDHLVLFQKSRSLVYSDPRQFGRVTLHIGKTPPPWWLNRPPAPHEHEFSLEHMNEFLKRHGRLPVKGVLLLQRGFPGIGNWMADEILWQAGVNPQRRVANLRPMEIQNLWKSARAICRTALRTIGTQFDDPPKGWLFYQRWSRTGKCPRHGVQLHCATVAGRTTVWCAACQR